MQASLDTAVAAHLKVQPAQVLERLRLTAGKAADLCGVTRRQLCYWTDKGIIPCCGNGRSATRRVYDFTGLSKALMLKRLMDAGLGLRRAVRELKTQWVEPEPCVVEDRDLGHETELLAQAERLARIGDTARALSTRNAGREALERLALALQPLAEAGRAASEGHIVATDRARDIATLVADAERSLSRLG